MHGRTPPRGREGADVSLVLPAYNPGPQIEETWRDLAAFLPTAPGRWEALFVCDGCTDGTPEHLQALIGGRTDVGVLHYAPNRGKGYAVRHGLMAARGEHRIFVDVDLAYGFDDVLRLANVLR